MGSGKILGSYFLNFGVVENFSRNSSQNWLVVFVWVNNNGEYANLPVFRACERLFGAGWAVIKAGVKKWLKTKILMFEGSEVVLCVLLCQILSVTKC